MGTGSSAIAKTKQIGNDYFKAGDYSKAAIAYSKAIEHDSANSALLSNRSVCNVRLGKLREALEDALACVSAAPEWNKGYFRLASAFKACGLFAEALYSAELSQSILADPITKALIDELAAKTPFKGRNTVYVWGDQYPRPSIFKPLEGIQVIDLACGINHCLAITQWNMVYVWGDNSYSQCGLQGDCHSPRLLVPLLTSKAIAAVAGGGHSLVICENGDLYSWGINANGQCGTSGNTHVPTKVQIAGRVRAGSAGLGHTMLLMDTGHVLASGWNSSGQLGVGHRENLSSFTDIGVQEANYISCGAAHTLVVLKNGQAWSSGGNSCGQLGLGHTRDVDKLCYIEGLKDISIGRCGEEFTIVVSSRNEVYSFGKYYLGLGNVGQLGYESNMSAVPRAVEKAPQSSGVEYVACTKSTVLALTRNHSMLTWGLLPDYSSLGISAKLQIDMLKARKAREIQCLRDSFVMCADYVIKSSYVSGIPLKSVEAGKKHEGIIMLVDSSLMFVNEPLDRVSAVCFNSLGAISKGEVNCFWENSKSIIELKITEAGYHHLYVFCNGMQLKNSPVVYTVSHDEYRYAKIFSSSENILINSGVEFILLARIFDRFDNLVMVDPGLAFAINIKGSCEIIDFEEGCYRLRVRCYEPGQHKLCISESGKPLSVVIQDIVDSSDVRDLETKDHVKVQVLPGVISVAHCLVEGIKPAYEAGTDLRFKIITKDALGNTTWHRTRPWIIEWPLSYESEESLDCCSTEVKSRCIKTGLFRIKVGYENLTLFDSEITVYPGPVEIDHTVIKGEGARDCIFTKPCSKAFTAEFFDSYFNPCPTELQVEAANKFQITRTAENSYNVTYEISKAGAILLRLITANSSVDVKVTAVKDPKLVKQELAEKLQEDRRLKLAEEQKAREEWESQKNIEEEMRRKAELRKKEKEMETAAHKMKELEDLELARRQKIVERIKAQEMSKKRGLEALKKLEEEKKKKEVTKMKRTGGGFVVPFITGDDT